VTIEGKKLVQGESNQAGRMPESDTGWLTLR